MQTKAEKLQAEIVQKRERLMLELKAYSQWPLFPAIEDYVTARLELLDHDMTQRMIRHTKPLMIAADLQED